MVVAVSNTANATADASGATTHSFTSQSFGAAAADRLMFAGISRFGIDGAVSITSATIGGVAATRVTSQAFSGFGGFGYVSWWWAAVPTGTTGTVVVNHTSDSFSEDDIMLYRVVGANTTTPVSASNQNSSATGSVAASLAIPTNGAGLGMAVQGFHAQSNLSWTNLTLDANQDLFGFSGTESTSSSTTGGTSTRTATSSAGTTDCMGLVLVSLKIPGGANNQNVTVTQAKSASLQKSAGKLVNIAQSKIASLSRNVAKSIAITQVKTASLLKSISHRVSVTQAKLASIVSAAVRPKSIAVTQAKVAAVTRVFAKNQFVTVVQAKIASLGTRQINKFITITQGKTASLRKAVTHGVISITQGKTATLLKGAGKSITLAQAKIAVLGPNSINKRIVAVQGKVASLVRSTSHSIRIVQVKLASSVVHKAKNVLLLVTQIKTAALRTRPTTPAQAVQVLKNIITRQRIIKNTVTRVRILKNIVTRSSE